MSKLCILEYEYLVILLSLLLSGRGFHKHIGVEALHCWTGGNAEASTWILWRLRGCALVVAALLVRCFIAFEL